MLFPLQSSSLQNLRHRHFTHKIEFSKQPISPSTPIYSYILRSLYLSPDTHTHIYPQYSFSCPSPAAAKTKTHVVANRRTLLFPAGKTCSLLLATFSFHLSTHSLHSRTDKYHIQYILSSIFKTNNKTHIIK